MNMQYILGVQRFVADANGIRKPKMYWGKKYYPTAKECIEANIDYIASHIGEKFTLGFFSPTLDESKPE